MILPLMMKRRSGARIILWLDLEVCDYAAPRHARQHRRDGRHGAAMLGRGPRGAAAARPSRDLSDPRLRGGSPQSPGPSAAGETHGPHGLGARDQRRPQDVCRPKLHQERVQGTAQVQAPDRASRRDPLLGRASREADLASAFDCLLEQRKRRFQALGRFDLFDREGIPDFYRNAALNGLSNGPAGLWCLSVNEEIIATSYCLVNDGIIYGLVLTTAGESWKNCSPGIVMVGELMQWAAEQNFTYMDMTVGSLPYKSQFWRED